MATTLWTPTRVTLGKGAEDRLGEELRREGAKRVLIHYGSERIVKDGLMKRLTDQLDEEGISYVKLGGVQPNPRVSLVRKGIELSRTEDVPKTFQRRMPLMPDSPALRRGLHSEVPRESWRKHLQHGLYGSRKRQGSARQA